MATTSASAAATLSSLTIVRKAGAQQRKRNAVSIGGLNSFGGLKAYNNKVASLGLPACTEESFAKVVKAIVSQSKGRGGGGALTSTCNAAVEIFQIASTINGLVLVGVAIGFVLLRIEAAVEEAE